MVIRKFRILKLLICSHMSYTAKCVALNYFTFLVCQEETIWGYFPIVLVLFGIVRFLLPPLYQGKREKK